MTITYEALIAFLSLIVLIGGAVGVIWKAVNKALQPYREIGVKFTDIGDKMDRDKKRLDQHDNDLAETRQQIDEDQKVHKLQNKALLNIINHMIDGNNVADMKKTRDDIVEFMTEE